MTGFCRSLVVGARELFGAGITAVLVRGHGPCFREGLARAIFPSRCTCGEKARSGARRTPPQPACV